MQKAPQVLVLHLKQEKTVLLSIAEHGAIIPYLPIYFMRVCVCVCVCVYVRVCVCVWIFVCGQTTLSLKLQSVCVNGEAS